MLALNPLWRKALCQWYWLSYHEFTTIRSDFRKPSTIDTITVRQDSEGRYCLNDLHKAAGNSPKDAPLQWMRNGSYVSLAMQLADESVQNCTVSPVTTKMGRNGGTYVCRELVYAYAMWISPAFHLKVIRAYDRLATQGVAVHENAAEDLLKNPLKYLEAIIGQAKEPAMPRDQLPEV